MPNFPQALCCSDPLSSPPMVSYPTRFWLRVLPLLLEKGKTLRPPLSRGEHAPVLWEITPSVLFHLMALQNRAPLLSKSPPT